MRTILAENLKELVKHDIDEEIAQRLIKIIPLMEGHTHKMELVSKLKLKKEVDLRARIKVVRQHIQATKV